MVLSPPNQGGDVGYYRLRALVSATLWAALPLLALFGVWHTQSELHAINDLCSAFLPSLANLHPKPRLPPKKKIPGEKKCFFFESDESVEGVIPRAKKPKENPHAKASKAVPTPKPTTAHMPPLKAAHTPKDGGDAAAKKGGIVGMVAHVPYPLGVEKGTVRGVHGWKGGVVWLEYPGNTTLHQVARHFLFPTLEEAERHRHDAQGGKRNPKTEPPAPANQETNPLTNPDKEPNPPTDPRNRTTKMWDPTAGAP